MKQQPIMRHQDVPSEGEPMRRHKANDWKCAKAPARAVSARSGTALVEFAVAAPIFFLLVIGLIEFSRMSMCNQLLAGAVREGARIGTVPGSTSGDVIQQVNVVLAAGLVDGATVTVEPTTISNLDQGDQFKVTAEVPYDDVSWLPVPQWLGGELLRAESVMTREGK